MFNNLDIQLLDEGDVQGRGNQCIEVGRRSSNNDQREVGELENSSLTEKNYHLNLNLRQGSTFTGQIVVAEPTSFLAEL